MNFVEIIRGIGNVLVVMAIAGAVAYVGDRVGHQVGRRRLTLFGIRPRYTSTIIAIGTGMVIALVVTLVAIFASQQVKTAFFKLNSINQQIGELQRRARDLETKVNTGRLIEPVDVPMVPFVRFIEQSTAPAQRLSSIRSFYYDSVKFINATYPRLGLQAYVDPPDIEKRLESFDLQVAAQQSQGRVMLTATSDQNLFEHDPIHFGINSTIDVRYFVKGQVIAQLTIPGKSGANIGFALNQLQTDVSVSARRRGLSPTFLAENIKLEQLIPDIQQMQQRVDKRGSFALTAFAASDYYPHMGQIPIVIVLTQESGS
ncbi:MAG TPA: DUF3084 domain-containing protein [Candidatus Tumulicola sp.]|jgi:hypothetical protein